MSVSLRLSLLTKAAGIWQMGAGKGGPYTKKSFGGCSKG